MKKPFKVPEIKNYTANREKEEEIIKNITKAKSFFGFIEKENCQYEFLFSGFGESELAMLMILFDYHPELFMFVKDAIVNTQLYREDDLEGFKYQAALVDYIKRDNKR